MSSFTYYRAVAAAHKICFIQILNKNVNLANSQSNPPATTFCAVLCLNVCNVLIHLQQKQLKNNQKCKFKHRKFQKCAKITVYAHCKNNSNSNESIIHQLPTGYFTLSAALKLLTLQPWLQRSLDNFAHRQRTLIHAQRPSPLDKQTAD